MRLAVICPLLQRIASAFCTHMPSSVAVRASRKLETVPIFIVSWCSYLQTLRPYLHLTSYFRFSPRFFDNQGGAKAQKKVTHTRAGMQPIDPLAFGHTSGEDSCYVSGPFSPPVRGGTPRLLGERTRRDCVDLQTSWSVDIWTRVPQRGRDRAHSL